MVKTTLIERKKFADGIKTQLELLNYGFKFEHNSYSIEGYTLDTARKMPAILELNELLNQWIIKPEKQEGFIPYPEAKRRIKYILDPNYINRCTIVMQVI